MLRNRPWYGPFAAIMLGVLAACSGGAETSEQGEALPVGVVVAELQDTYETERLFTGRVSAAQETALAFEVGGRIASLDVDVGDVVNVGEVLGTLDAERLTLRRREAEAARDEAEAALVRAEATLTRTEALLADGYATTQERDDALADRDGARKAVAGLSSEVARAARDERDAALVAPFAGTVTRRMADEGTTITAGEPVLALDQQGGLEASVGVPTALARRLRVGDEHAMRMDDQTVRATVTGIGTAIDPATRTRTVRLAVPADAADPGALVRLPLTSVREGQGAWVPLSALTEGYRGLWSVYVVLDRDGEDRIARRDVEVISLGDDRAYVAGTLEDGDRVVRAAPFRFVPGQRVRVVPDRSAAPALGMSARR